MKRNKVYLDMYLHKNLGDDLFLKIISERYKNTRFYIYSAKDYRNDFINVKQYPILFTNYYKNNYRKTENSHYLKPIKNLIKKSDYLITLGGSVFIESNKNNVYPYIDLKYSNKPYFILGANFGPYETDKYFNTYHEVFKNSYDVCFREKKSFDLFSNIDKVRCARDIVFSLDTSKYKITNDKKVIISVIDLKSREKLMNYSEDYENSIIDIANYFINKEYEVILMSFCKSEGDEKAIERIIKSIKSNKVSKYYYNGNIEEALKEFSNSEYIIATRFHAMILGFVFNKKVLPIIYSDKMTNVLENIKYNGEMVKLNDIKSFKIEKRINNIKKIEYDIDLLRKDAEKQFEILDMYLN